MAQVLVFLASAIASAAERLDPGPFPGPLRPLDLPFAGFPFWKLLLPPKVVGGRVDPPLAGDTPFGCAHLDVPFLPLRLPLPLPLLRKFCKDTNAIS